MTLGKVADNRGVGQMPARPYPTDPVGRAGPIRPVPFAE